MIQSRRYNLQQQQDCSSLVKRVEPLALLFGFLRCPNFYLERQEISAQACSSSLLVCSTKATYEFNSIQFNHAQTFSVSQLVILVTGIWSRWLASNWHTLAVCQADDDDAAYYMKNFQYNTTNKITTTMTNGAYCLHAASQFNLLAPHLNCFDSSTNLLDIFDAPAVTNVVHKAVNIRSPLLIHTVELLPSIQHLLDVLPHDILYVIELVCQTTPILQAKGHYSGLQLEHTVKYIDKPCYPMGRSIPFSTAEVACLHPRQVD
jgi:hypothetical protein